MNKHLIYAGRVAAHRWYVFVECCKLGIIWRGLTHDLSKLLHDEWFPYVEYFNGERLQDGSRPRYVQEDFDEAWLKHQHRNPHHWQFWRLREDDGGTKLIPMPAKYVREMLADWRGAGKAYTGSSDISKWYKENRHKIELAEETRRLLHSLMTPNELKALD